MRSGAAKLRLGTDECADIQKPTVTYAVKELADKRAGDLFENPRLFCGDLAERPRKLALLSEQVLFTFEERRLEQNLD